LSRGARRRPEATIRDACVTDAVATWVDANQSEFEAH
jgi:hypothetical protein